MKKGWWPAPTEMQSQCRPSLGRSPGSKAKGRTAVLPFGNPPGASPRHEWEEFGNARLGDGRSKSGLVATCQLIPFIPVLRRVQERWLECGNWRRPAGRGRL